MTKNNSNVRIFGSPDDSVWFAPSGPGVIPETITETMQKGLMPSPYVDAGWIEEGGIPMELDSSSTEIRGHQGHGVVRVKPSSTDRTVKLAMLESTPLAWRLHQGVSTTDISGAGAGMAKMSLKRSLPQVTGTALVYARDEALEARNDVWYLWVFEEVQVSERESTTISVEDVHAFGVTLKSTGEVWVYTNDPAIVAASTAG